MDLQFFLDKYQKSRDGDYPFRHHVLSVYRKYIEGNLYNCLDKAFHETGGGQVSLDLLNMYSAYEPRMFDNFDKNSVSSRRPSVKVNIGKIVSEQAVSFVFDQDHFPTIQCEEQEAQDFFDGMISDSSLDYYIQELALTSTVGSGCIVIKVLQGKFFYEVLKSEYLTPRFNPNNPNELIELQEKYKCTGEHLIAEGFTKAVGNDGYLVDIIPDARTKYWYMRAWDLNREVCYIPWVAEKSVGGMKKIDPREDKSRTVVHSLGFVPAIWIKLPGYCQDNTASKIDGQCIFRDAIDNNIVLDYQLSQTARGLMYSAEPLLFIKNPGVGLEGNIDKSAGAILHCGENSDAKMVEINGDGCKAALAFSEVIRELAIENIHGNRSRPETARAGHSSGRAMEFLHQALVMLAGRLRVCYGERGLKPILNIILKIAHRYEVIVNNKRYHFKNMEDVDIKLMWPAWFASSEQDMKAEAEMLVHLKDAGIISGETATAYMADDLGIQDIPTELQTIEKEQLAFIEMNQPKVSETKTL